jgi:hypothetical protein
VSAQQNVTPIAVAASSDSHNTTQSPANAAVPIDNTMLIDAIPLTNGSIALSWQPIEKVRQYRVYSDMGTGYGVYIYKNHTAIQPAFVDELLRPGMTYQYRVSHLTNGQEIMLGQAQVSTFAEKADTNNKLTNQSTMPSASVTAQPTALPPDAVLLGLVSDHNFTDSFNTLTIVGEVRNDSPSEVGNTSIAVTFYDGAGAVIDTAHGKTMLESIPSGDTAPFLISLSRPAGLASYSLRAVASPATTESRPQLSVTETRRFEDEAGFFHIKGSIKNVGSTTAKRIKVAAVIYGRDTRVINVNFAYVNPPNLAPGQQGTYDVIFTYYPAYFDQTVIPFEE